MIRRKFLGALAGAGASLAAHQVLARSNEIHTIIVPFPAGGPSDVAARRLMPFLSSVSNVTAVVENVSGGGGALAIARLLQSRMPGTVFYGSPSDAILTPTFVKEAKYKPEDLRLIAVASKGAQVICVSPKLGVRTVDQFVELGRQRALSFGSFGVASIQHIVGSVVFGAGRMKMLHVPYRGAVPAQTDVMSGVVDSVSLSLTSGAKELIESGKLIAIGVVANERDRGALQIPTINEGRYIKGLDVPAWSGIFVARKTAAEEAAKLSEVYRGIFREPELRAQIEQSGWHAADPELSQAATNEFYLSEVRRYEALLKTIKLVD